MSSPDPSSPEKSSQQLISANSIGISFADRVILKDISLTVSEGQVLSLIGPNGAGKTTLIRLLLGLLQADTGSIERSKNLKVGYMPQRMKLEHTLPVSVNRFLALSPRSTSQSIDELLKLLKIEHLSGQQLSSVSGGELQRVLLARALLGNPQLLILDEPAQGVDIAGQAELYQLIGDISTQRNCGVLMISHDLHLVMSATDEVVCLNHHVCCHGKPEQVSNDPAFLELFGASVSEGLAVYSHNHNHEHELSGDIKPS